MTAFIRLESCVDQVFNAFVNLMQEIAANQDLHEDGEAAHEVNHGPFTEEVADLIEDISVEQATIDMEETEDRNTGTEREMLYENGRITVGENLLLTMAFIMGHKLSMVASRDLITLLELHCPEKDNAVNLENSSNI